MEKGITIYSDGGARGNPGPAACAAIFFNDGKMIYKASKFLGARTNNEAEYEGVLNALYLLIKNPKWITGSTIVFFLDSELVVNQLKGLYKIKKSELAVLSLQIKNLEKKISARIIYKHIPREKNSLADTLVNKTLDNF